LLKKIKSYFKEKRKSYYTNKNKRYKKFKIGEYTYGKPKIYSDPESIEIGKFCSLADGVTIYSGGEHNYNWVSTYNFFPRLSNKICSKSKGKVKIGNDVWIADGALILSGVTIEDGAVIGARAVVSKDVAPYEIVAGNPARHIRYRFDAETIQELSEIKWWDWDIEKIKDNFDLILSDDISKFIEKHKV